MNIEKNALDSRKKMCARKRTSELKCCEGATVKRDV